MAIIKRKVMPYGAQGHVVVPKSKIGEEVVMVYGDDFEELKGIIRATYYSSSLYEKKISDINYELNDLKARVGFIERFLPSVQNLDKKSNEIQQEQKPVPLQEDA